MCVAHAHATRCARPAPCDPRVRERPRSFRADLDGIIELVPPKYYFAAPEANAAPRKFQKHVGKPAQVPKHQRKLEAIERRKEKVRAAPAARRSPRPCRSPAVLFFARSWTRRTS